MKKIKTLTVAVLLAVFAAFSVLAITSLNANTASAETTAETETAEQIAQKADSEIEPILWTSLSLAIDGGDGKVWATVKNEFTLFPSTVWVILELYSSDTYQESHLNMTLVGRESTLDLDMGHTLTITASTGGVQKYWQGRMRYKIDNDEWKEGNTGTLLYDADGNFLNIV